jgi:hypothetical protein
MLIVKELLFKGLIVCGFFYFEYRSMTGKIHVFSVVSRIKHSFSCIIVYSWGRGEDGQLGLGDTSDQLRPIMIEALQDRLIIQIACGSGHTVVLTGNFSYLTSL